MSHLDTTDATHFAVEDLLSRAQSLAITGASDSNSGEARRALAMEVDQIIQSAVDLGNRRFDGAYIFGGTQTLTPPYTLATNDEGLVQSVTVNPQGIDKPVLRQVGRDVSLSIHISGDDVFGGNQEVFQNLMDLRDALLAEDVPKIQSMQIALEKDQTRTIGSHSLVGSLIRRSETLETRLLDDEIASESGRSQVEDLDIGRAMLEFNQAQTALEAALNAGAKILESSLLRYL
jgi:flagellar hook-associated protein 3 FlgL